MTLVEPSRGLVELFYRADVLNAHIDELEQRGASTVRVDGGSWNKEAALEDLRVALDFPDHYGSNLDALSDCMFDVVAGECGFQGSSGTRLLALYQFDSLARADQWFAHQLVDVLYEAAVMALKLGKPFLVMLQSDDPDLSIGPVGTTHIGWNRTEWARSSRA
ncbi:MAG: barstar family protein [Acidimicrobiales bacterium]|nr:barstar family protein [Acidimicrobiales bacterium]